MYSVNSMKLTNTDWPYFFTYPVPGLKLLKVPLLLREHDHAVMSLVVQLLSAYTHHLQLNIFHYIPNFQIVVEIK